MAAQYLKILRCVIPAEGFSPSGGICGSPERDQEQSNPKQFTVVILT
jgi:hypothetical protein